MLLTLVVALMVALTASSLAPSFAGHDHLKNRRHHVNTHLRSANHNLDESSAALVFATKALQRAQGRLDTARSKLAATRGQLAAAVERDRQMQAALTEAEGRLNAAEAALAEGRRRVKQAEDRLAAFVVNSYQYGSPTLTSLSALLDGGSSSDLSERMSMLDSVAGAQSANVDQLNAAKTLLTIRAQQVADVRDEVATRRAAAAQNLQLKQRLETAAQQQARAVRSLVDDRRAAEVRAERAKQRDLRQIRTLHRERVRISTMLTRLAQRQQGRNLHVPNTGGFLSMPVTNTHITSPYGMRLHPILKIWELHDGTDLAAACGTPVYAAAAGTVVSEYYNVGYGKRVLINHGKVNGVSLATSYNHLSRFVVPAGAQVKRGQLIAYSGTTGYSTGCHLHFMVYVNGATVNPVTWL